MKYRGIKEIQDRKCTRFNSSLPFDPRGYDRKRIFRPTEDTKRCSDTRVLPRLSAM